MSRIIGTAGHIDHGKTALIKALTGIETDRLREEKERGISIDLGFAWIDLPDDTRAGIVDVPGHERFIRNMLAGAHGIDLALFVIAADDGVMPQSEEHLDIVHLLGVPSGIVVITKTDLVESERVDEVREEIEILTLDTVLEGAPIIPVSSVTGAGLDTLRDEIVRRLPEAQRIRHQDEPFRMPIDRAFVVRGHGVVITGTATAGEVAPGNTLRILPGTDTYRVRTVQVHGNETTKAEHGQRVALNLAGAERVDVARGHVALAPSSAVTTDRFDALVEIRPFARKPVPTHRRVRLHIGTTEVFANLVLLDGRKVLAPKDRGWVQVRCENPVVAFRHDRFVLRAEGGDRTLGGGEVVHPFAPPHRARDGEVGLLLEAIRTGDTAEAIQALLHLDRKFTRTPEWLAGALNLLETDLQDAYKNPGLVTLPRTEAVEGVTTAERWDRWQAALLKRLALFHEENPMLPGMEMEPLRTGLPGKVSPKLFRSIIDRLAKEKHLVRTDSLVRLPDHEVRLGKDDQDLSVRLERLLEESGMTPPNVKSISATLDLNPQRVIDLLHALERSDRSVHVSDDLWFHPKVIVGIWEKTAEQIRTAGPISAADFRDLFGVTRKFAIPLLEYFDRQGLTIRVGDVRKLRRE